MDQSMTSDYMATKPDPVAEFSTPILTHMNEDHSDTTKAMVQHFITGGTEVRSKDIYFKGKERKGKGFVLYLGGIFVFSGRDFVLTCVQVLFLRWWSTIIKRRSTIVERAIHEGRHVQMFLLYFRQTFAFFGTPYFY